MTIIKRTMRTDSCRHYHVDAALPGEIFGTPQCGVGVENVVGEPVASLTCFARPERGCPKREEFPAEEKTAELKAALEREAKDDIMMKAWRESKLKPGDFKVIACPSCGGAFNVGRAGSNGHGRAHCEGCGWGFIA